MLAHHVHRQPGVWCILPFRSEMLRTGLALRAVVLSGATPIYLQQKSESNITEGETLIRSGFFGPHSEERRHKHGAYHMS